MKVEEFDFLPVFYSRVFDKSWIFYGRNDSPSYFSFGLGEATFGTVYLSSANAIEGIFLENGSGDFDAACAGAVRNALVLDQTALEGLKRDGGCTAAAFERHITKQLGAAA